MKHIGNVVPQVFHVRTYRHVAQLEEIAVLLIVDFRSRPTCIHLAARDDDGDGDLGGDLLGFPNYPLLVVFVLRRLESMDVVV